MRLLLQNGANVNDHDNCETALMIAVSEDNFDMVQLLLEFNASVNIQNEEGETALMIAKEQGNTQIIKLLKAAGAKR